MIRTTCPHCDSEFIVPDVAERNMDAYRNTLTIASPCCFKPVSIRPVVRLTVDIIKSRTTEKFDNFGVPFK